MKCPIYAYHKSEIANLRLPAPMTHNSFGWLFNYSLNIVLCLSLCVVLCCFYVVFDFSVCLHKFMSILCSIKNKYWKKEQIRTCLLSLSICSFILSHTIASQHIPSSIAQCTLNVKQTKENWIIMAHFEWRGRLTFRSCQYFLSVYSSIVCINFKWEIFTIAFVLQKETKKKCSNQ